MKFISLFSGIGGFDLAFERAGMECVSVCEIDKNAQSILKRHFPKAQLFDDVRKVGIATHERKSVDLICGGFPCQDVSIAGKRKGIAGERSGLWFEFARIIDELEPQWVVIENVPGLLSSNKGKDFAVIVQWLAERGYGVAWRVLDAQYFGVPQRRRRVFIVASFRSGSTAKVLFEPESSSRNIETSQKSWQDIAPTIGGVSNGGGANGPGRDVDSVMSLQVVSFDANRNLCDVSFNIAPTLTHNGDGKKAHGAYAKLSVMAHGQANAEIVSDGEPSLTTNHEAPIVWHNKQSAGEITVQNETMPTMSRTWGTGGNNVPFVGIRRLMPVECERLQGFPDGWTDGQSDSTRYRQLGNAVAVPVVEWIGKRIMKAKS